MDGLCPALLSIRKTGHVLYVKSRCSSSLEDIASAYHPCASLVVVDWMSHY